MIFVDTESFSLVFILICSFFVFLSIYLSKKVQFKNLILLGFVLRIFLMLADYYHWFPILNSGVDSEVFHKVALENQRSSVWKIWTNYTYFLTFIYYLTNSSRLIAQYINVLLGVGVMVFVQRSLSLLEIKKSVQKNVILIVVLLPNLIIFSGILLREAWIEFFVAASLFYFLKWFKTGSIKNILLTIVMIMLATIMHSGTISILIGYVIAFLIYNPKTQKTQISGNSIFSLILLIGIMILLMNHFEMFTSKFSNFNFDDPNAFVELTNTTNGGGSDYLTWIKADNVSQCLLLSPLKMFYFLFSPLPTEWRGISDVIGFLIDSIVYLWLCIGIYRFRDLQGFGKPLRMFLLISLLITVFIFAYGTYNAGTAFRHRAKLIPVILITYAVSLNYSTDKHKKNYKLNA